MIKITKRTDPLGASINNQQQIITGPLGASINNQQQIITGQLTLHIRSIYKTSHHDITEMTVNILLILPEHTRFFSGVRVSFMCMFCRSLFVILSFFFWPLCCLSFDLRILITSLWYLQTILERKYKRRDIRLIYMVRKTVPFIISL